MGPLSAISNAVVRTGTFSGRASRSEFWWFFLAYSLVFITCGFFDGLMVANLIAQEGEQAIFTFGIFDFASTYAWFLTLPTLISVTVRRLHDAGFSGFWLILYFIPLGAFALMVMHIMPSKNRTTAYGTPAAPTAAASPARKPSGETVPVDAHTRAMRGYALLFDKDKKVSPAEQAARKAEVSDYYRTQVLKSVKPV